jgi:hypothetical protein
MALGHIGVQQTIASLDEKSKEAGACKRFFEHCRDTTLRARPWPFATRYITLALVEEIPNPIWGYSYRYPSNCVNLRRVIPSDVTVDDNYRDPFVVASDDSGKLIYSNQVTAMAEITYRVVDPTLFDDSFVDALAWLVGARIGPSLSGNNAIKIVANAEARYNRALESAGSTAMNEGRVSTAPHSEFIAGRE